MKKGMLVLSLLSLLFTSCTFSPGYTEPESSAVVEALGFDLDGGTFSLTVQLADGDEVLSGRGRTPASALADAASGEFRTLELSHSAVAVLGDGISSDALDEVLGFLSLPDSAAPSICLLSSPSAEALLSGARGFELYEMISRRGESLDREARLYRVESAAADKEAFVLPRFHSKPEGFELSGVRIYQNGAPTAILGRAESAFCLMLRGGFAFGGDIGLERAAARFRRTARGGEVILSVKSRLSLDRTALSESITVFYTRMRELYGDVFCLSERFGEGAKIEIKCIAEGEG